MEGLITGLALLVAGAVAGLWVNEHAKRPKLAFEGAGFQSGGSPASGYPSLMMLKIINKPGFIGVRMGKTVILGKYIHGYVEKGTAVERRPAVGVRVAIFDADSIGSGIPLWMLPQEGDEVGEPTRTVALASGQYATVFVVGRRPSDNGYLAGIHPKWVNGGEWSPQDVANYVEPRSFIVRAQADRVKQVDYTFRVVRGPNERWSIERVTRTQSERHNF